MGGETVKRFLQPILVISVVLLTCAAWSAEISVVTPEEVGLSSDRLERLSTVMQQHVDEHRLAGVVALLARRGKIAYFETFGMQDVEADKRIEKDTIFRIYSMTKPITTVGAMILYEEGRFYVNDPVSKYLPELGGLDVGIEGTDPATGEPTFTLVPADREITIRDLMRHTSGMTYGLFGSTKVDKMYTKAGILTRDKTIEETVSKLGTMPLLYQPGTVWHYSAATDVLGRLVEVVSGVPLDEYFQTRILQPLDMKDTAFYVPKNKKDRLAAVYSPTDDGTIQPAAEGVSRDYLAPPTYFSGGGGLVSTARDYLRFCQMMLNGGELDGVRILSPKTVELMTTDHLGSINMRWQNAGYGFGLGFAVSKGPGHSGEIGSEGEYYWGGAAHTRFWIDPKEEFIGIFMTQLKPYGSHRYREQFRILSYQAIID